jgi:hypothetical protein
MRWRLAFRLLVAQDLRPGPQIVVNEEFRGG